MTHDFHWTFGKTCHISFPGGGDPVVETPHAFKSDEGCATYSDGSGQLLFYTDGQGLYDSAHGTVSSPPLGGSQSSSHSAIIVPPAGGGSLYHIFAVYDVTAPAPVVYTPVSAAAGITIAAPPTPLPFGPKRATERLAATSHKDCEKYWVISIEVDGTPPGPGRIFSMLVDSDAGPSASNTSQMAYPFPTVHAAYTCKFSPDGSLLAVTSFTSVEILNFDRSTGAFSAHSQITGATGNDVLYGVEFSPNGQFLYLSGILSGEVRRHVIAPSMTPIPYSTTTLVGTSTDLFHPKYRIGALQLGPNGKIYGAKVFGNTLLEIGDPDNPSAGAVQFNVNATEPEGNTLTLPEQSVVLGLPTFTRIADDCLVDDRCAKLAAEVNELLDRLELHNAMPTCTGEKPEPPRCAPLDIPPIEPQTYIRWGDSPCDCIEGDDTEVMHLTICNPYRNLTLSNLTVQQLVVVDAGGNPVPNLPSGDPSIQLVPIGPHCFDDIAPCTCVTREFVLRLRGAPGGPYQIRVKGICFDACFHGDTEACFQFEVCKD